MQHQSSKKLNLLHFFPEYIYNSDFYLAWCFLTVAYFWVLEKKIYLLEERRKKR